MFGRRLFKERAIAGLLLAAASVLVFYLSLEIPPPALEPIGSATFPRVISAILLLLSIATIALAFERPAAEAVHGGERGRVALTCWSLLLLIAYIAAMDFDLLGYRVATTGFLFVLGVSMLGFRPFRVLASALIALGIGFGTHFVFTQFLYIDLPQ